MRNLLMNKMKKQLTQKNILIISQFQIVSFTDLDIIELSDYYFLKDKIIKKNEK